MTMQKYAARALTADAAGTHRQTTILSAALVIMLGAFILFGAALAQPAALHDAAHDARHSFSIPCH